MADENVGFTILIVDDNPTNIDLLRRFLAPEHYQIAAFTSGEQALKLMAKIAPDLILLDIMMPGLDGYQVCQKLKQDSLYQHIPVIFVTAKVEPEDLRRGFTLGAADYITKPVNQDILLARVKNQQSCVRQLKLERQLLEESEKMAKLGHMVASIAHEVATPMSNIALAINCIYEETVKLHHALEQKQLNKHALADFFEMVEESLTLCEKNSQLANSVLSSFKQVAVNQCSQQVLRFNLHEYLLDVLQALRPTLKRLPHSVKLDIDPELSLLTYPGALSQVIINLINNSLVHGFGETNRGEITITARDTGDRAEIHYRDNGQGIAEADRELAFNPFFTTKAGQGGSGLGLSISKKLVENELKGSIALDPEHRPGVLFIITLSKDIQA
ncbi:hybrid sensor histidine kinase/response regulator [Thalassomonas sp. RHCl1]|uniref:ATP-binding response regulator n=1 Tax=Thalassomonas sp. RHCl1 TaxID=2995320 RepID=UPI00248AFDBE|nr:hybrid sensor histidine kinase/response regulator [Thalassomonas sp. RHCl1]